jgi:hypothetical protein
MNESNKKGCQALVKVSSPLSSHRTPDKPLPVYVSRRHVIRLGAISVAALTLKPVHGMFAPPPPPVFSKWKTFLGFVGIAATALGFGPVGQLLTGFLSSLGKGNRADAITGLIEELVRRGYADPRQWPQGIPFDLLKNGPRISFPVLKGDELNGIMSFFNFDHSTSNALAKIAAPTTGVFGSLDNALRSAGYKRQVRVPMLLPADQNRASFGTFEETYKEDDVFVTEGNTTTRAHYQNNRPGAGVLEMAMENLRHPRTGRRIVLDFTPAPVEYPVVQE